ncbi:MAG: hypothetical protein ABIP41_09960 [Croceibacterium sp.]
MKLPWPLALMALTLVACGETPEQHQARQREAADRQLISESEWFLRKAMREPDSTVLDSVHIAAGTFAEAKVVCGKVNGRNGFGGMTGFQRFVVMAGKVPMVESDGVGQRGFRDVWDKAGC